VEGNLAWGSIGEESFLTVDINVSVQAIQNRPLVSVIMPCYNAQQYLAEAISSVLAQTYRPLELIIIDDASSDRSFDIASSFGASVRVFKNDRNRERSWSRNRGIRESKGCLLAYIDADDLWPVDKIERQVYVMSQNPDCGMSYGKMQIFTSGRNERIFSTACGGGVCGVRADRQLVRGNVIPLLTVMMRRECFARAGGFDCAPWVQGCEDYDLWLRVTRHTSIIFLDEVLGYYREHPAQTSQNKAAIATTAARVRWRYIERYPDVLLGKKSHDRWCDRYGELDNFARQALAQRRRKDALSASIALLSRNPFVLKWYMIVMKALVGTVR
jgi:glycosyltransferase involved in cell wall biosynthesis